MNLNQQSNVLLLRLRRCRALQGFGWVVAAFLIASITAGARASNQTLAAAATQQAFDTRACLTTYCVTCHNQRLKTAGVMFDTLDLGNVPADAQTWEKAIRKV